MNQAFDQMRNDSPQIVAYINEQITHICHHLPPREPGSIGEHKAGEYMAGILSHECGCPGVKVESFPEHPSAFYCYFRCSMVFDTLCALLYFVHPGLSILTGCIALTLFLFQFVLYRQMIDPFFPLKQGTNVTALRPCTDEPRQRIFLNGHMDAAWEFTLNYHFGGIVFELPGLLATVGVFYYIAISICSLMGISEWTQNAALWGLLFLPFFLLLGLTYNPHRIVPGANDNLTGCLISIAILREMEQQGIELRHTELGVNLTGSEEAGLRGSKAWCKAHKNDYQDVPTYIISIDTIQDPKEFMVNRRDLNGTVSTDQEICDLYSRAAKNMGVPCKSGQIPLFGGASDGAGFAQGGFRSISVTGMNHKLERFYHTQLDTPDKLSEEAIHNCYLATLEMIRLIDQASEADHFCQRSIK